MAGYRRALILGGGLLFSLLIALGHGDQTAPTSSEKESASPGFVLPQKHKTSLTRAEQNGQTLYGYYCTLCHGKTGEGDGFNSYNLIPPPAKHADPARMDARSDARIQRVIKNGGSAMGLSLQMPPWGGVLTDKEISDLTAFVRTLARRSGHKVNGTK